MSPGIPDSVETAFGENLYQTYIKTYQDWFRFNKKEGNKIHLWNLIHGILMSWDDKIDPDTARELGNWDEYTDICAAVSLPDMSEEVVGDSWQTWLNVQLMNNEKLAAVTDIPLLPKESKDGAHTYETKVKTVKKEPTFIKFGRRLYKNRYLLENAATNFVGYLENDESKIDEYNNPRKNDPDRPRKYKPWKHSHFTYPPYRADLERTFAGKNFPTAFETMDYRDRVRIASKLTIGLSGSQAGREFLKREVKKSFNGDDCTFDIFDLIHPDDGGRYFDEEPIPYELYRPSDPEAVEDQTTLINNLSVLVSNFKPGVMQLYEDEGHSQVVWRFFRDTIDSFKRYYNVELPSKFQEADWAEHPGPIEESVEEFLRDKEGSADVPTQYLAALGKTISTRAGYHFQGAIPWASAVTVMFAGIGLGSSIVAEKEGIVQAREMVSVTQSVVSAGDAFISQTKNIEGNEIPSKLLKEDPASLAKQDFHFGKSGFGTVAEFLGPMMDIMDIFKHIQGIHSRSEVGDDDAAVAHGIGVVGGSMGIAAFVMRITGVGLTAGGLLLGFGTVIASLTPALIMISRDSPLVTWLKHTYFGHRFFEMPGHLYHHPEKMFYRFKVDGKPNCARMVSEFYSMMNPIDVRYARIDIHENDVGDKYWVLGVKIGNDTGPLKEGAKPFYFSEDDDGKENLQSSMWVQVRPLQVPRWSEVSDTFSSGADVDDIYDHAGVNSYSTERLHTVKLGFPRVGPKSKERNWRTRQISCFKFTRKYATLNEPDSQWKGIFESKRADEYPPLVDVIGIPKSEMPYDYPPSAVSGDPGPSGHPNSGHYVEIVLMTESQALTWRKSKQKLKPSDEESGQFTTEDIPGVRRKRIPLEIKEEKLLEDTDSDIDAWDRLKRISGSGED